MSTFGYANTSFPSKKCTQSAIHSDSQVNCGLDAFRSEQFENAPKQPIKHKVCMMGYLWTNRAGFVTWKARSSPFQVRPVGGVSEERTNTHLPTEFGVNVKAPLTCDYTALTADLEGN